MFLGFVVAVAFCTTCFAAIRFAYYRQQRVVVIGILAIYVVIYLSGSHIFTTMAVCAGVLGGWSIWQLVMRRREIEAWRSRPDDALILRPPGPGSWVVAIGGPFAKHNHHTNVTGERFAYDLVKTDSESFGAAILSPVDGRVEHVRSTLDDFVMRSFGRDEDGVDLRYGNFVSIRTERGRVLLCHLRKGSIRVVPDQFVSCGDFIAECGQSGRSFEPHLHVHAQDAPATKYGDAVPIAFMSGGRARTLVPGDRLP